MNKFICSFVVIALLTLFSPTTHAMNNFPNDKDTSMVHKCKQFLSSRGVQVSLTTTIALIGLYFYFQTTESQTSCEESINRKLKIIQEFFRQVPNEAYEFCTKKCWSFFNYLDWSFVTICEWAVEYNNDTANLLFTFPGCHFSDLAEELNFPC